MKCAVGERPLPYILCKCIFYTNAGGKMITIMNGAWITDLSSMICRNIESGIKVSFRKKGIAFEWKIEDIPMKLLEKWAIEPHGERHIKKAAEEAEKVFLRAYFESKIE
jgi:hypothetical protein